MLQRKGMSSSQRTQNCVPRNLLNVLCKFKKGELAKLTGAPNFVPQRFATRRKNSKQMEGQPSSQRSPNYVPGDLLDMRGKFKRGELAELTGEPNFVPQRFATLSKNLEQREGQPSSQRAPNHVPRALLDVLGKFRKGELAELRALPTKICHI